MRFQCSICKEEFTSPLRTLDWRLQRQSFADKGDAVQTTVHIEYVHSLVNYCSPDCRQRHEPDFIEVMGLKFLSPKVVPIMPCGKCGRPVDGTQPHGAFAQVTLELDDDDDIGHCTGDRQLAVLCGDCIVLGAEEDAAETRARERVRE